MARARTEGVELTGENGLLTALVRQVLQTGPEVELSDHLGYEPHAVEGRGSGNSRNGSYPKTVTTDVGPVELRVLGIATPPSTRSRSLELPRFDGHLMMASSGEEVVVVGGRRKFTPEFKAEAVEMVEAAGGSIAQVAKELGIYDSSLGNWVRQARAEAKGRTERRGAGRDP